MAILDSASLIVTPNGYKASKLYSIVPTDGSGDMTFTRTGDTGTRVNQNGLIEIVTANKPRLDYLNSTCPKVLFEPQRTNLLQRSEEFDNSYWAKDTIVANSVISPDGTQNADTFVSRTGNYTFLIRNITLSNATAYSYSIFVKKSNYRYVGFGAFQTRNGENYNTYDFDTNTVNNTIAPSYPLQFVNYPNGWVRLIMNFTTNTTNQSFTLVFVNSTGYDLFTAPTGSEYYIWGAQLEVGSYATSYIPTVAATVTRNADDMTKTGITALLPQNEGTVYYEINNIANDGVQKSIDISNGSDSYRIHLSYGTTLNQLTINIWTASSTYSRNIILSNSLNKIKVAVSYKSNNIFWCINGVKYNLDTTITFTSMVLSQINFKQWWGGTPFYGGLNNFALWKTALTDTDCITLTTL